VFLQFRSLRNRRSRHQPNHRHRLTHRRRKTSGERSVIAMPKNEAKFQVGQIIHHKLFEYVGVVFDVDPTFQGTDEWYRQVARSRPPKDKPWYHVLVNEAAHTTYVAEQNLEPAETPQRIVHPFADRLFHEFDGERYKLRQQAH
jgi:heat shock protein HspQ